MKLNKWGVFGLTLGVAAFGVNRECSLITRNPGNLCLVLYILLLCCALVCGNVAARRGSKAWLALSFCAVLLVVQAVIAIVVE
jgi:hypothetical protein